VKEVAVVLSDLVERLGLSSRDDRTAGDDRRNGQSRRQQALDDDVAGEKSKAEDRRGAFRYEDYGVPAAACGYPPAVRGQ
jgi:hypothetical protein